MELFELRQGVEFDCVEDDLAACLPSGSLIILNHTGKIIFQDLVLEKRARSEAAKHLSEAFGISESDAFADVDSFIDQLISKDLIRRAPKAANPR